MIKAPKSTSATPKSTSATPKTTKQFAAAPEPMSTVPKTKQPKQSQMTMAIPKKTSAPKSKC